MVLIKELQGLAVDVKMYTSAGNEIDLKKAEEEYVKNPNLFRSKKNGKSKIEEREALRKAREEAAEKAAVAAAADDFEDVDDSAASFEMPENN